MIKYFTFIFSFIFVEKIQQSPWQGDKRCSDISSILLFLTEQVPHLFVNLVPPMDVSLLYELHGGSSSSCEIMGWWVKYRLFRLTLLWHGVIHVIWPFQLPKLHAWFSFIILLGFISWGRSFLIWVKSCWVVSVIWATSIF